MVRASRGENRITTRTNSKRITAIYRPGKVGKSMSVIKKKSLMTCVLFLFYCVLQPIHFMSCCECRKQVGKGGFTSYIKNSSI